MYNPIDLNRIDRQIEDLQRMKANIQGYNPPPINNIITTPQQQVNTPIFEAKFSTENPNDVFIKNKTAFINLKDNILSIKEVDGEVKEYTIVPPKDEKDIRIQQLENEIMQLKQNYNNLQINNESQQVNRANIQEQPVIQNNQMNLNNQNNFNEDPSIYNYEDNNEDINYSNYKEKQSKFKFKK